jgi:hypothetical protein
MMMRKPPRDGHAGLARGRYIRPDLSAISVIVSGTG